MLLLIIGLAPSRILASSKILKGQALETAGFSKRKDGLIPQGKVELRLTHAVEEARAGAVDEIT